MIGKNVLIKKYDSFRTKIFDLKREKAELVQRERYYNEEHTKALNDLQEVYELLEEIPEDKDIYSELFRGNEVIKIKADYADILRAQVNINEIFRSKKNLKRK